MNSSLTPEEKPELESPGEVISIICWPYASTESLPTIPGANRQNLVFDKSIKKQHKLIKTATSKRQRNLLTESWTRLKNRQRKQKNQLKKEQQQLLKKESEQDLKFLDKLSHFIGRPFFLLMTISIFAIVIESCSLFPKGSPYLPLVIFASWLLWVISINLWQLPPATTYLLPRSLYRVVFSPHNIEFRKLIWGTNTASAATVPWRDISKIYLKRSQEIPPSEYQLCFREESGKVWSLKFQQIGTKQQWEEILKAIDKWCWARTDDLDRDAFNLTSPNDNNFTQLWLQSLSEPVAKHDLKPLTSGTVIGDGRFVVQKQIGVGGQGRAYLAIDKNECKVVIKEYLLPIYVDIKARRRALENFQQECSLLISLNHPNIVKLIEFFSEDHRAFMVLEYIDGLSFKGLLQNAEPMQLNQVIDYGKTLCDILIYMHGRTPPVVHGDFTPDNLIVNQNGVLKLIDFTIAQQSDSTFTSIAAGKPSYMPPEQYRGLITTQSDIYAMGATLYYLLTGEDPEPLSCLHPTTLRAEIPISLDTIVAKCTALNTADRYQSAIQVRQAIDELK